MADGGYYEPYGSNVDNPAGLMPSMGSYRGDPGYGKLDNFQLKVMGRNIGLTNGEWAPPFWFQVSLLIVI